jgi:hypothetical protein
MTFNDTILPDMFYIKLEHKDSFLKLVQAKEEWSGTGTAHKWYKFLQLGTGRKCDFSGEVFKPDDEVYCVYVYGIKTN